MAAPRVFVSSTYYDLHHVRHDLKLFLDGLGYTPVMHDKGGIAYAQGEETLEQSCYSELATCDIVVCIVGGKFGTKSSEGDFSITMKELTEAVRQNKTIYVFIQNDVYVENRTYAMNKDTGKFKPAMVDNIKVHEFIFELKENIKNHPIKEFSTISDITTYLQQQFAGMFQKLLSQQAAQTESKTFHDIKEATDLIKSLTKDFIDEKEAFFNKFEGSIFAANRTIHHICNKIGIKKFALFCKNLDSLEEFLFFIGLEKEPFSPPDKYEYTYSIEGKEHFLTIDRSVFDEYGNVKDIRKSPEELDKLINYGPVADYLSIDEDDDLPF